MTVGNAFRESLVLLATHQRETFVFCVQALVICALGSAVIVMAQNSMMKGVDRIRAVRVFSTVVREWCRMVDSLIEGRIREALRHLGYGIGYWFEWKSLTLVGRLDSRLIACVGGLGVAFLGADSVEAAFRLAELLFKK